jgi:Fe-S cluster biogenesis protein NfuA/nitrite reductase/ring-hydroxylating ferredoxin subunit
MNATLTAPQPPPSKADPKSNGKAGPTPQSRGDIHQQGKRLTALIGSIESLADPRARELLHETLQAVLALHGDGLARVLQLVKNGGAEGRPIQEALLRDKMVRGLLLIHGLHPDPLEKRLDSALAKVRPYLQSHGGNVELIHLKDDVARLRLQGTCQSCPSSSVTLELAVRQAVEEACPDLAGFEVEGMIEPGAHAEHRPADAPQWVSVEDAGYLTEGQMRSVPIAQTPVLFIKAGGNHYAYRDFCPACETSLDNAVLEDKTLICRAGHRFDVQRAGLCPSDPAIHLEPIPLLAANGVVRVSVKQP